MKLQTAVRAFLAARFPCAFEEPILLTRINRSGVLDDPATPETLHRALVTLAQRFREAEVLTDNDGTQAWSATPLGVSTWTQQDKPYVGD